MAIEETDPNLDDEAQKKRDEEADKRIKDTEAKLREAEIARARAEGEAEALKRTTDKTPAPVVVSDEQWASMEAETGLTRTQIQANAKMMDAIAEGKSAPLRAATAAAEERARKAEERAARAEGRHSLSRVEEDFYKNNPGFSAHRGEVESYLKKFPEATDPKKLAELLDDAKIYVRGKVREEIGTRRRSGGSTEREIGKERENLDDNDGVEREELDLSGLDNDGAKRLVGDLHKNFGNLSHRSEKRAKETVSAWKKESSSDGRGVAIDATEEFARGNALLDGDSALGGSRGER